MIIISMGIGIGVVIGTYLLNKRSYGEEKLSQYECGFEPIEERPGIETRERFYIRYYIIGIIFLVFDLEAILLYPYTTIMAHTTSYIIFILFMIFLTIGLIYEYKKGVLSS